MTLSYWIASCRHPFAFENRLLRQAAQGGWTGVEGLGRDWAQTSLIVIDTLTHL
jgi:hypothetical protein